MLRTIVIFGSLSGFLVLFIHLMDFGFKSDFWLADFLLILSATLFILTGVIINRLFTSKRFNLKNIEGNALLSKQEQRVLHLLSEGCSNREVAEALFISENTVKSHISNIYSKLDARRRTEAIKKARELKLI